MMSAIGSPNERSSSSCGYFRASFISKGAMQCRPSRAGMVTRSFPRGSDCSSATTALVIGLHCVSQALAARGAVEEAHAQAFFEEAYMLADHRPGHLEGVGRR